MSQLYRFPELENNSYIYNLNWDEFYARYCNSSSLRAGLEKTLQTVAFACFFLSERLEIEGEGDDLLPSIKKSTHFVCSLLISLIYEVLKHFKLQYKT